MMISFLLVKRGLPIRIYLPRKSPSLACLCTILSESCGRLCGGWKMFRIIIISIRILGLAYLKFIILVLVFCKLFRFSFDVCRKS